MLRFGPKLPSYEALRRKIKRETEASLTYGLSHPEAVPRIPTIEVGSGSFHPAFAKRYWLDRLGLSETEYETHGAR